MVILDTNALVRFFTDDDERKASQVATLLESKEDLFIPEVVFPELEYVLQGLYAASRLEVLKAFQFLTGLSAVSLTKSTKEAIRLYGQSSLDMADCLIAHQGDQDDSLASFDKQLLKLSKKKSYWK